MNAPYKTDVDSGLNIVILSLVTFLTTPSISRSTTLQPSGLGLDPPGSAYPE